MVTKLVVFSNFALCIYFAIGLDMKNSRLASAVPIDGARTRVKEISRKEVILKASHRKLYDKIISFGSNWFGAFDLSIRVYIDLVRDSESIRLVGQDLGHKSLPS